VIVATDIQWIPAYVKRLQLRKAIKAVPKKATKAPFNVRLDLDERAALEAAGAAEDRPAAYVARRAILEWLKEKGFLK